MTRGSDKLIFLWLFLLRQLFTICWDRSRFRFSLIIRLWQWKLKRPDKNEAKQTWKIGQRRKNFGNNYWFNDYARSNQNSAFPTSIYYKKIKFQSFTFLFGVFLPQFSASFHSTSKFSDHYNLFIHYTHHNSQFHLPEQHQFGVSCFINKI